LFDSTIRKNEIKTRTKYALFKGITFVDPLMYTHKGQHVYLTLYICNFTLSVKQCYGKSSATIQII